MKFKNEFWVIIPARSGSKSIKNKNLLKIKNKPLIAYSVIAANKNKTFKKIIFSSDSIRYYKIARKYGKCIFHKRSKKASSDKATEIEVIKDFFKYYKKLNKPLPKFIVSFRPTSPLRNSKTINEGLRLFKKHSSKYSSLKSLTLMSETSYKTFRIIGKKLSAICKKDFNLDKYDRSRHTYQKTYEANGILDIYKSENILRGTLLGNKVFPYVTREINPDIDSIEDVKYLRYVTKKKKFF